MMSKENIKLLLKQHRVTQAAIARKLCVSLTSVHLTISGKTVSARIRQAIAEAIGKPVNEIWPDTTTNQEAA
jgi:transcriptional regulator with XRE-family HTH domain